ncbi:SDR family NAD(P)-dependent oxidoreductase [Candidatus Woesearchaeota archaeon]|nr:SDR family NAD(P)-dependent oxidoreductase [Candidatus Woesearchaeota archaeon]
MNEQKGSKVILITGGAGFIGSHLAEALIHQNERIVIVDSINNYYDPRRKEENLAFIRQKANVVICQQDITDYDAMEDIVRKNRVTHIVHLAARAGVRASINNPQVYVDDNIIGTLVILELCRKHDIKHLIVASSSSIYGTNTKVPFSETDIVENIISPYGVTKRACELYSYCYHRLYGFPITCLRFFTVYGPRGRPDMMVYKFTKAILESTPIQVFGEGTTQRDYTFVTDIVEGIIAALNTPMKFEIINLGNSSPVELRRIITILEELLGKKAIQEHHPLPPGDVSVTYADISKAQRLLGYKPKIKIGEGLARFVAWYHQQEASK